MKLLWIGLILCFLSFWPQVHAQTGDGNDFLLQLRNSDGEAFRSQIMLFYDSIAHITDYQSKMKLAGRLFDLTLQKDEIAHIHSLLFRAMHSGKKQTGLFDQAFKIAEKHLRIDDMNNVEFSRARYFMAQRQYDSAMVFLLKYRDRTPPDLKGEGYRNIINLLGDIYYHVGYYSRAGEVYAEMLDQYEAEDNWNFFRPYVLMNNLGQIAYHSGNLPEARQWFTRSLKMAEEHLHTSFRNNTMGYIKIKLAEVAMGQDSLDVAFRLLNEVSAYPENSIYEDVSQEYLYTKARLLLMQGKPDEAERLANELKPGDTMRSGVYLFVPDIYRLLADIYTCKQDYIQAMHYNDRYRIIEDSLRAQENLAASMIIFEDYNHELTRIELLRSRQRLIFAATGLIVVFSMLLITLAFYRKLYRSKLELVRKSMEVGPSSEMQVPEIGAVTGNGYIGDDEIKKQKELIRALKALMEKQKPFLDPGLTIVETARQLNTNRTYLSKAINNQLKTTFPNFVNEYRIRESIRLIVSGYTKDRTQEALARQSGFANRTVFIAAFKKFTGVLPSFFIANYKKWDHQKNRFSDNE